MGRTIGAARVTLHEVERIRQLYRADVKLRDIEKAAVRGESTIARAVRGLKRKKPARPVGRHSERNDRILRAVEKGRTHARVAEQFGLCVLTIGFVIAGHPRIAQLVHNSVKLATIAARFRLELSTVQRIAGQKVARDRVRPW